MPPPSGKPARRPTTIPVTSTGYPALEAVGRGDSFGGDDRGGAGRRGAVGRRLGGLGHPHALARKQRDDPAGRLAARIRHAFGPRGASRRRRPRPGRTGCRRTCELGHRLLGGQRRHPVGPRGGHRLERVGDVEDPGQPRDLVTQQPVRVARAVVPLVVMADDRQLRRQLRDRRDDLRAQHRVAFMFVRSSLVSSLLLEQDVVAHADLADVMEQAAPLERLELLGEHCMTRPMSTAICFTRRQWFAVNGSRLSTAWARLWMVWVNISRISSDAWFAIRVMYIGTAKRTRRPPTPESSRFSP